MNNAQATDLIFDLSKPGRRCHRLPPSDVPDAGPLDRLIPAGHLGDAPPLPEVGEIDLIRHFTNLSTRNMCIDTNFYPLGSCTMKYNPKRHERLGSRLPGIVDLSTRMQDGEQHSGAARTASRDAADTWLRSSGLPAVSLQPAAGAHGELTALFVAAAYFRDKGRDAANARCIFPDECSRDQPRQCGDGRV